MLSIFFCAVSHLQGGVGALVFSLATKNLAEGMVGSFALNAWDAFDVYVSFM